MRKDLLRRWTKIGTKIAKSGNRLTGIAVMDETNLAVFPVQPTQPKRS